MLLPLLLTAVLAVHAPGMGAPAPPRAGLAEYGMTCGLLGHLDSADRAFTALLSRAPGDARALNGLGNVALLRGDAALAERFFAAAETADAADAGLALNRAVALLVGGDTLGAQIAAAKGIDLAGDSRAAADLLGLESSGGRAGTRGAMSLPIAAQELRQFLDGVARRLKELLPRSRGAAPAVTGPAVPSADSAAVGADSLRASRVKPLPPPTLRIAGPRAGRPDGRDLVDVLYWKR